MNFDERLIRILLEAADIKGERGEFIRISKGDRTQTRREMAAAKKGRETKVKNLKGVENTDASDIEPGFGGLRKAVKLLKSYKRDKTTRRRAFDLVKADEDDPSIIRTSGKGKSKKRRLVGGNTRAIFRRALGLPIKAHVYKGN
tara:strand:- start:63 stop:494 length:432 start_codon:yes stop_codon:yes gene_type:complete